MNTNTNTNPIKKVHCIADKKFVVIDDRLARNLGISSENTWFEQLQIEDGIMLKIRNFLPTSDKVNLDGGSFVDKNQAQITSINPNDHNEAEVYDRSQPERSFAKNDQNYAQNTAPNDPNDPNDLLHTSYDQKPIIYRLGDSDTWGCKNCRLRGDIHEMRDHVCH